MQLPLLGVDGEKERAWWRSYNFISSTKKIAKKICLLNVDWASELMTGQH